MRMSLSLCADKLVDRGLVLVRDEPYVETDEWKEESSVMMETESVVTGVHVFVDSIKIEVAVVAAARVNPAADRV